MARIVALVDRLPDDREWKGAFAWDIILGLAEAQHEVLALSCSDLTTVEITHSRLNIARPAKSFGLQYFAKWIQALFQFQPEIVHTFALRQPKVRGLTIWPMMESGLNVFPRIRRYSTALSPEDFCPFSTVQAPLDVNQFSIRDPVNGIRDTVVIPAAVSDWHRPQESLLLLNEFLLSNREHQVHVVGGWGNLPLGDRRTGWRTLEAVNQQVHMGEPLSLPKFLELVSQAKGLWLRSLKPASWHSLVAAHLAQQFQLPTWGEVPQLNTGSPANFLSRLYSSN